MVDPADKTVRLEPGGVGPPRPADLPDITTLVRDHYRAVYRYAFRLTGRPEDAEDITQQTFLMAHRKLDQLRDPEKADRWLFAVLRSCYFKSRRRSHPSLAANLELNVDQIPDPAAQREEIDREQLQQALDGLSDDDKSILAMFYFEQLSYKEIAQQLEIAMGTVMSRLARAKARLRRQLLVQDAAEPSGGALHGQEATFWSKD